MTIGSDFAS